MTILPLDSSAAGLSDPHRATGRAPASTASHEVRQAGDVDHLADIGPIHPDGEESARPATRPASGRGAVEPGFFGPLERPLFGRLHRATGGVAGATPALGMVICNPFGYEAICAHRSLRRFAEDAAALGIPVLRFDYDGTGDSFGSELDADRLGAWVASIDHAIDHLTRVSGATRVVLFGVRLGATLASLAAAARADVAGIVALAPVVSGRAYVRELRALQMALGLAPPPASATPSTAASAPAGARARGDDAGQEAVGFALSGETRGALAAIDLTRLTGAGWPTPEILLIDRDDLPASAAWMDQLRAHGAVVEHRALPGYREMVLDPHKAEIPEAMRASARSWLQRLVASVASASSAKMKGTDSTGGASAEPSGPGPGPSPGQAVVARGSDGAPTVIEEAGFIDPGSTVFGVIARPAALGGPHLAGPDEGSRLGILLLNAGAIHHIGPSRLYVTLARAWAGEGHTVLRVDLSGIGDSGTRPGQVDNVVYGPNAGADVRAAIRHLHAQPGVSRVVIVGLCSGAYHGFKAAVAGEPVFAIVPINPLTFFWKEGMSLDFPAHKVAEESHRYGQSALRLESWKKLVRGEVHLRVLTQILARRALSLVERRARDVARQLGVPMPDDLGSELDSLATRGIAVDFVFADGDPGMELLPLQGGSVVPRLSSENKLRAHVIAGPDHTFTARWSHALLGERLTSVIRAHSRAADPGRVRGGQGHGPRREPGDA